MSLLVLERRAHEQRQNLIEERPSTELARFVRQLTQRRLALRRRTILDLLTSTSTITITFLVCKQQASKPASKHSAAHLEEESENSAFFELFRRQVILIDILEQLFEVLLLIRANRRQAYKARADKICSQSELGGSDGSHTPFTLDAGRLRHDTVSALSDAARHLIAVHCQRCGCHCGLSTASKPVKPVKPSERA